MDEQRYAGFKLIMRKIGIRNDLEAKEALRNIIRIPRMMFFLSIPTVFLSIALIPLFGFGLIMLIPAGFMLFYTRKQVKRYRSFGERYIVERSWEENHVAT